MHFWYFTKPRLGGKPALLGKRGEGGSLDSALDEVQKFSDSPKHFHAGWGNFSPQLGAFLVKFRPKISNFNAPKWPSTILGCNFRSRTSFQILICGIDAELNSESIPHTPRPQNRRRKSILGHFCFGSKDFSWAF